MIMHIFSQSIVHSVLQYIHIQDEENGWECSGLIHSCRRHDDHHSALLRRRDNRERG